MKHLLLFSMTLLLLSSCGKKDTFDNTVEDSGVNADSSPLVCAGVDAFNQCSTPTPTPTPADDQSSSPTPTPTPSVTSTPVVSPTPEVSATPVVSPTPTPSVPPTATPVVSPTATVTPAPTVTPSAYPKSYTTEAGFFYHRLMFRHLHALKDAVEPAPLASVKPNPIDLGDFNLKSFEQACSGHTRFMLGDFFYAQFIEEMNRVGIENIVEKYFPDHVRRTMWREACVVPETVTLTEDAHDPSLLIVDKFLVSGQTYQATFKTVDRKPSLGYDTDACIVTDDPVKTPMNLFPNAARPPRCVAVLVLVKLEKVTKRGRFPYVGKLPPIAASRYTFKKKIPGRPVEDMFSFRVFDQRGYGTMKWSAETGGVIPRSGFGNLQVREGENNAWAVERAAQQAALGYVTIAKDRGAVISAGMDYNIFAKTLYKESHRIKNIIENTPNNCDPDHKSQRYFYDVRTVDRLYLDKKIDNCIYYWPSDYRQGCKSGAIPADKCAPAGH